MQKHIFIGCDIGTSSTKAVAVNESGTILAQASRAYATIRPKNNWAEQDPDLLLSAAIHCIRSVIEALPSQKEIRSICISALYGGTGALCDESMNIIRPSIIWMDRRAEVESQFLRDSLGEEALFNSSGNGIDSYFGYTKLLWVKKHEPDLWKNIRYILPLHSYIIYKLTGMLSVDYSSAGNIGGIYDYHTHSWSKDLCKKLDIPFEHLPQHFHLPEDLIGISNDTSTRDLGLEHPVPFCAGTVDCIASMLSASIIAPGENAAVLGTSLNWGYIHKQKPNNPNLVSMPYCISPKELSYTYGGASTAGALPRWFVENFTDNTPDIYATLEQDIKTLQIPPGCNGLITLPYFMGERTPIWDEHASGVMFGLTLSHTKAHMYRSILESVAFSLCHIMESMEQDAIQQIILVGGGSRSTLWKQIFADVTGLPVLTPVNEIEAPIGDAFLAAKGYGYVTDYAKIKEWINMNPAIQPNPETHQLYQSTFSVYKELYINLKSTMKKHAKLTNRIKGESSYEH